MTTKQSVYVNIKKELSRAPAILQSPQCDVLVGAPNAVLDTATSSYTPSAHIMPATSGAELGQIDPKL